MNCLMFIPFFISVVCYFILYLQLAFPLTMFVSLPFIS